MNVTPKQIIASKVVKTNEGKGYLEVEGSPFLMGHVQNCGGQQLKGNSANEPYPKPLPVSWLENCFEKTAALNYKTISIIIKWNEIEPKAQGKFDWTLIDFYIDWANKYNLYIDIAWFGTNACGGTRLPGHGRGWACWVPEYVQDYDKYFGNGYNRYETNSEINCPWLPDEGYHHKDAENLFWWERNAVHQLFNHLAIKDINHRTILFQVFNEPNCHSEWFSKKHIWLDLINKMGKTIKESDYVVAARVNIARDVIDSDISSLGYIDFVGCDPYMANVSGIRESLYSGESNIPYIAENYGHLSNTSSLAITSLIHGGYYDTWQLNDHWEDFGMYSKTEETYLAWEIGKIPQMRESGKDISCLNKSLNKIGSIIATTSVGKMLGYNIETDNPVKIYKSKGKYIEKLNVDFSCDDGSVGMALSCKEIVYFVSDTSNYVIFTVYKRPRAVSGGYIDKNGYWINEKDIVAIENVDGSFDIKCNTCECVRVEF